MGRDVAALARGVQRAVGQRPSPAQAAGGQRPVRDRAARVAAARAAAVEAAGAEVGELPLDALSATLASLDASLKRDETDGNDIVSYITGVKSQSAAGAQL